MTKAPSCILCQSNSVKLFFRSKRLPGARLTSGEALCTGEIGARGKHGKIFRCGNCGFIFQEHTFSKEELSEAYSEGIDELYFEQFRERRELFTSALNRVNEYRQPPGRLLDVGSGPGIFLRVAKKHGWDVEGVEPSIWSSKVANTIFGVKVKTGDFESTELKKNNYDVLTMWDVLEHFADPVFALSKAHKLLKDDGILALTTINIDSWFSRLLGPHWTWLIRIHLWYFNERTLKLMLERTGYQVLWIGRQVRWFSLPYLVSRFTGKDFSWFPKVILPAPTGDILFVIARKS